MISPEYFRNRSIIGKKFPFTVCSNFQLLKFEMKDVTFFYLATSVLLVFLINISRSLKNFLTLAFFIIEKNVTNLRVPK